MKYQKNIDKSAIYTMDPLSILCLMALITAFIISFIIVSAPLPSFAATAPEPGQLPQALITPETAYANQAAELAETIRKMAVQLFDNLEDPDPELGLLADGIAVSSFVDLKKLSRTSSFGRYLAEQLMTEFQQKGYTVIEVRKSNAIIIQEKHGEYGLSRDVQEINTAVAARTMITGTYTIAGDQIMVNAKVVDNKDATLLSSATVLFPKTRLADLLLSDSSSASPKKNAVTYMKRLEPSPPNMY